jgi:predicted SprT family Zn-dependent metalloprotease
MMKVLAGVVASALAFATAYNHAEQQAEQLFLERSAAVQVEAKNLLVRACSHHSCRHPIDVITDYSLENGWAGQTDCYAHAITVYINRKLLNYENPEVFYRVLHDTLPHEIAHAVLCTSGSFHWHEHGEEWRTLMGQLGPDVQINPTHQYPGLK